MWRKEGFGKGGRRRLKRQNELKPMERGFVRYAFTLRQV
jgi:hypothetical protein